MAEKLLIIVDMQNDFLTGSLANPDGVKIVPNIVNLIKSWTGRILVTQDTHESNYEHTLEGKWLSIKHCIKPHAGWCINDAILEALEEVIPDKVLFIEKETFGALGIRNEIDGRWGSYPPEEIHICGVCTDICVISNALILKSSYPETQVVCHTECCAASGVSDEQRKARQSAAFTIMNSCQIKLTDKGLTLEDLK